MAKCLSICVQVYVCTCVHACGHVHAGAWEGCIKIPSLCLLPVNLTMVPWENHRLWPSQASHQLNYGFLCLLQRDALSPVESPAFHLASEDLSRRLLGCGHRSPQPQEPYSSEEKSGRGPSHNNLHQEVLAMLGGAHLFICLFPRSSPVTEDGTQDSQARWALRPSQGTWRPFD